MAMVVYLYHSGKEDNHRGWIMRRLFCLQLCDSNIDITDKKKSSRQIYSVIFSKISSVYFLDYFFLMSTVSTAVL